VEVGRYYVKLVPHPPHIPEGRVALRSDAWHEREQEFAGAKLQQRVRRYAQAATSCIATACGLLVCALTHGVMEGDATARMTNDGVGKDGHSAGPICGGGTSGGVHGTYLEMNGAAPCTASTMNLQSISGMKNGELSGRS